jgi:hypothetical protein
LPFKNSIQRMRALVVAREACLQRAEATTTTLQVEPNLHNRRAPQNRESRPRLGRLRPNLSFVDSNNNNDNFLCLECTRTN